MNCLKSEMKHSRRLNSLSSIMHHASFCNNRIHKTPVTSLRMPRGRVKVRAGVSFENPRISEKNGLVGKPWLGENNCVKPQIATGRIIVLAYLGHRQ